MEIINGVIILTSPDGTLWTLKIDNLGILTTEIYIAV